MTNEEKQQLRILAQKYLEAMSLIDMLSLLESVCEDKADLWRHYENTFEKIIKRENGE